MTFRETRNKLLKKYEKFMHLKIYIVKDDIDLINAYKKHINDYNSKLTNSNLNRAFDLLSPGDNTNIDNSMSLTTAYPGKINILDYKIKCKSYIIKSISCYSCGFYINSCYNLIKTNMRLACNQVISPTYNDNIKVGFDIIPKKVDNIIIDTQFKGKKFDKYVQIIGPELCPIYVELVDSVEDLLLDKYLSNKEIIESVNDLDIAAFIDNT